MKNDDAQRSMGTKDDQDSSRQAPGRSEQGSQQGGQKGARDLGDDKESGTGKTGGQNRGGENR